VKCSVSLLLNMYDHIYSGDLLKSHIELHVYVLLVAVS